MILEQIGPEAVWHYGRASTYIWVNYYNITLHNGLNGGREGQSKNKFRSLAVSCMLQE